MLKLSEIFAVADSLMEACEIDVLEIKRNELNEVFFTTLDKQRLLNSFLFNFSKLQDKIGAKLFRQVLIELKEIEDESAPMRDILNILERLEIVKSAAQWDKIREIRNSLAHDYPNSLSEKISSVRLALEGYQMLKEIFLQLRNYSNEKQLL